MPPLLERYLVHPVVILTAGVLEDRYHNPVADDWTNPHRSSVVRGWLAQQRMTELQGDREAIVSDWVLRVPLGTPISAGSRVESQVDGATYTVQGDPYVVPTPDGPSHVRANLMRVAG